LRAELEVFEQQLSEKREQKVFGVLFVTGKMHGRPVVLVRTGAGKLNAAVATTLLIEHFGPREVLFSGTAGGINPELFPGDVVIAEKTAQYDSGRITSEGFQYRGARNPLNGERNPVFFAADPRLLDLAMSVRQHTVLGKVRWPQGERVSQLVTGVIVTGDAFVSSTAKNSELRKNLQADATEMDGAAVAQICWQFGVPCLVISWSQRPGRRSSRYGFRNVF
jgi:adenosylhomocysteine nucleosidase